MDKLSIDLEITDGNVDSALQASKAKLQNFANDASKIKISAGTDLEKTLSAAERQASNLRFELRKVAEVTIGKQGVDGLGQAANRAVVQVTDIYTRLRQIEAASARTNDPRLLASLKQQAVDAQGELTKLESKLQRVAAGRAAAAERNAGSGGLGKYAGVAGAASSFLPPELQQGIGLLQGATEAFGAGTIATFGALAVAGVALVKISENIREEAEKRSAAEDKITGAWNRQVESGKQIVDNIQKMRNDAQFDRVLDRRLEAYKTYTDESLQSRKKTLEDLVNLNPSSPNVQNYGQELSGIDSILDQRKNGKSFADVSKDFWEGVKKREEDAANTQREFNKSVEEGKSKVEAMSKAWTSAFDSLYQRTAGENPFAAFLAKSQTESDKLTESLKGLDPTLRKIGLTMLAVAQGKDLFALRINNTLGSYDLRSDAANFRNPFDPSKLQNDEDKFVQRFLANNPNYLYLNAGLSQDQIRKDILGRGDFDTPEKRLNKSLDDKYNLIYNRRDPSFDLGAADRAFNAATQGVNPLELSESNRQAAAISREREAARRENYEADAQKTRAEQLAVQKLIAANTVGLNKAVENGGKLALDLTLKNETGDPGTAKVATQDDVKNTFHFDGFGIAGGTNF